MTVSTLDYALMAGAAYDSTRADGNKIPRPDGWEPLEPGTTFEHRLDTISGFEAVAFINQATHEIVISFAGTNGTKDITGDWLQGNITSAVGLPATQLSLAACYYEDIKARYGTYDISFTGHSLGGGLASLMGVFFDKTAVTFDPAPFMLAANMATQATLLAALATAGYPLDTDLINFAASGVFIRGSGKVSGYYVQGEALQYLPFPVIGHQQEISHASGGVSPVSLHDIELLIALKQFPVLGSEGISFLIGDLYNTSLFASPDREQAEPKDLLTHLIRYEFGVPGVENSRKGLLTKFAADAELVAGFASADQDLKQGLMQLAMHSYYNTVNSDGKQFFEAVGGGIRFDLSGNIGDSAIAADELEGYEALKTWILGRITGDEATAAVTGYLAEGRRMTLVLDAGGGADALADNTADLMILGANGGWLNGKGGDDLLVGGNGMDALTGGTGDDTLVGGGGIDTYLYRIGDGNDKIIDSDKKGRIFVSSADGKINYDASLFIKDKNNPNLYKSADGEVTLANNGSGYQIQVQGGSLDLEGLGEGDLASFGIHLRDAAEDMGQVEPTNTIMGDKEDDKKDSLSGEGSGDLIDGLTDDDSLSGNGGNDRLLGGEGKDHLYGGAGDDLLEGGTEDDSLDGDADKDKLQGGKGRDTLDGGTEDDILEGGEDKDILVGGDGKDRLYGDTEADLAQAITNGRTDAGNDKNGDWLNGANGDDILIGTKDKDALFGGQGDDILVGGAGDDWLNGDDDYTATSFDWTITNNGNTFDRHHQPMTIGDGNDTAAGGSDVLYGGAGNDFLAGLRGNDVLYGEADDDTLAGDDGEDALFGGDGNDTMTGDYGKLAYDSGGGTIAQGNDYLDGGAGDDWMQGEGGDDILIGGADKDQLIGDAEYLDGSAHGADYLEGGTGDDNLWGMGGDDVLVGGDNDDYLQGDYSVSALPETFHGNDFLDGGAGKDTLIGDGGDDILNGGTEDDSLDGGKGNDTLYGGAGNDGLHGSEGNDLLVGGAGTDFMDGGEGDDRYELMAGEGQLSADGEAEGISDSGGVDTVVIGGAISSVYQNPGSDDVVIGYGSNDWIVVQGGAKGSIEHFEAGGETLSYEQLVGRYSQSIVTGVDADGFAHMAGGTGDDTLYGGDGNTVFSGGRGNDFMEGGGGGNNTYVFNQGDGIDGINDAANSNNVVRLGEGLLAEDVGVNVSVSGDGSRYLMLDFGNGDQLSIRDGAGGVITEFQFDDGTVLSTSDLMAKATTVDLLGSGSADTLYGSSGNDVLNGVGGEDVLIGQAGDDHLYGGNGNDRLEGGDGTDNLDGGAGDDTLIGGAGNDTYWLWQGMGNDRIVESDGTTNTIRIANGATLGLLTSSRAGNDLLLAFKGGVGSMRLVDYYITAQDWQVEFPNGAVSSIADFLAGLSQSSIATVADIKAEYQSVVTAGWQGQYLESGWTLGSDGILRGTSGFDTVETALRFDAVQSSGLNDHLSFSVTSTRVVSGSISVPVHGSPSIGAPGSFGLDGLIYIPPDTSGVSQGSLDYGSQYGHFFWIGEGADGASKSIGWGGLGKQIGAVSRPTYRVTTTYHVADVSGTDANDTIAVVMQGIVNGGAGDDVLTVDWSDYGLLGSWSDPSSSSLPGAMLLGNVGDDTLDGGMQADVLVGGEDSDSQDGGYGGDTYYLVGNTGTDTIADTGNDFAAYRQDYYAKLGLSGEEVAQRGRYGGNWIVPFFDGYYAAFTSEQEAQAFAASPISSADVYYYEPLPALPPPIAGNDYAMIAQLVTEGVIQPDRVVFGAGVNAGNIVVSGGLDNGYVTVTAPDGSGVTLGLPNADDLVGTGIELLQFADGTEITLGQLAALGAGSSGDDRVLLGSQNDHVSTGAGNDTLSGGQGNNVLDGGIGDDIYIHNREGGDDLVVDSAGHDRVVFGAGISATDVTVARDQDGKVTLTVVSNYYYGGDIRFDELGNGAYAIEEVSFADGTVWYADDLTSRLSAATDMVATKPLLDTTVMTGKPWTYEIDAGSLYAGSHLGYDDQLNVVATLDDGSPLSSWMQCIHGYQRDFSSGGEEFSYYEASGGWLTLVGTPDESQAGDYRIRVTTVDPRSGISASSVFAVHVRPDSAPIANGPIADQRAKQDYEFIFTVPEDAFSDADVAYGDSLSYTITQADGSALPSWLSFDASWNGLIGTPASGDVGQLSLKVTATDESGLSATQNFDLTVVDSSTNAAPTTGTMIGTQLAIQGQAFSLALPDDAFVDVDQQYEDWLTYSATQADGSALPSWLIFDKTMNTLTGTPGNGDVGNQSVKITATDTGGLSASQTFALSVSNVNDAPTAGTQIADQSGTQGQAFSFAIPTNAFSDPDTAYGDTLSYSVTKADGTALPSWLTFNASTRTFQGTPTTSGTLSIQVTATDSGGLAASDVFDISIAAGDQTLNGTASTDTLIGGVGNDALNGGAGNDVLEGDPAETNDVITVDSLVIQARGSAVDGGYPTMEVWVDGTMLQTFTVDATSLTPYQVNVPAGTSAREVSIRFVNDAYKPEIGQDRNLYIDQIVVNGHAIKANAPGVAIDFGVGAAASDGLNTIQSYGNIYSNGAMRFSLVGADLLDGGTGADLMTGGIGNDVYLVDDLGDMVTEAVDAGYDLVKSSISYALSDNVEALILTGSTNLNGTGNAGQNTLTGNAGANRLDGGAGKDHMAGGAGDDTYIVDDGGDTVVEGLNAGTDTVLSSATFTLGGNVENLVLTGSSNINGTGNTLDNLIVGNGGYNTLTGNTGSDVLQGSGGNDLLYGGEGNDVLEGDEVSALDMVALDTLVVHARGSAVDGVYPTMEIWADGIWLATVTVDVAAFSAYAISVPAGTLAREISVRFTNDAYKPEIGQDRNLYVDQIVVNGQAIKGTAPGVTIDFGNAGAAVDGINTILSYGNVYSNGAMRFALAGSDLLDGGAGADTLRGGVGNDVYVVDDVGDVIDEASGAGYDLVRSSVTYVLGDTLEALTLTGMANIDGTGNATHNLLVGNTGANRLDGGLGNDTLNGGTGNDTYLLGRGYGADTVTENDSTAGNTDIASFLSGIGTDQIWFRHVGTALEVSVIGTSDKLTINNWYSGNQYHVEQFKTADGKLLVDSKVETLVQAMAAFSPPAAGQTTLPSNYQTALQPVIAANWQ
jgi:Ca2+-binding RTX toxin-like protein